MEFLPESGEDAEAVGVGAAGKAYAMLPGCLLRHDNRVARSDGRADHGVVLSFASAPSAAPRYWSASPVKDPKITQ